MKHSVALLLFLVFATFPSWQPPRELPQVRSEAQESPRAATSTREPVRSVVADVPDPPLDESPSPLERRRRESVLGLIRYPWQDLGYHITFLAPRPGYRAMTISDKRRIEIYARPADTVTMIAFDLAHELGHAFDLENNNHDRRQRWREIRGIAADVPWFGCNRCPDYETPAGDFAETFAYLLLGPGSFHSRMGPPPAPEQMPELTDLCQTERLRGEFWALVRSKIPSRSADE